ncbi:MAG TPA: DUF350 domain-containing protein [Myxococcales bacterium]|nr:DUF350 domain-containing protein [Myxococcales bacterium]HIN85338.1 DUF350 domain-containing protein [Myxococcales bacterium]
MMDWSAIGTQLGQAAVFTALGLVLFAISYVLIDRCVPFDLKKELTEDDNTAVGVMLAGVFIGIGLIIAAAIQ